MRNRAQTRRDKHVHDLVGKARRRVEGAELFKRTRGVTGLFFEFARRRSLWILTALELARAKLDQPTLDCNPAIAHKHHRPVVLHRNHGDSTGMSNHIADRCGCCSTIQRPFGSELQALDADDRPLMRDRGLRWRGFTACRKRKIVRDRLRVAAIEVRTVRFACHARLHKIPITRDLRSMR